MFDCTGLDKTVEGLAGCLTKKLKERLAEKGTSQLQTKTLKRTTETKQIVGRPKRYNAQSNGAAFCVRCLCLLLCQPLKHRGLPPALLTQQPD